MADVRLLEGERLLDTSKANAVIVAYDYGLSRFAADDLLPLVGLAGTEAIGGHLSVTSLRLVFVAHRFNRVKGSTSIPLTAIEDARNWRSGLAVGVQIVTRLASFQYVTWSRSRLLRAISDARRTLGPDKERQIEAVSQLLEGFEVRRAAETLNIAARNLFDITRSKPTVLELTGLLNFQDRGRNES